MRQKFEPFERVGLFAVRYWSCCGRRPASVVWKHRRFATWKWPAIRNLRRPRNCRDSICSELRTFGACQMSCYSAASKLARRADFGVADFRTNPSHSTVACPNKRPCRGRQQVEKSERRGPSQATWPAFSGRRDSWHLPRVPKFRTTDLLACGNTTGVRLPRSRPAGALSLRRTLCICLPCFLARRTAAEDPRRKERRWLSSPRFGSAAWP